MTHLKIVFRATLYFALGFYIIWFLLRIALTPNHYIDKTNIFLLALFVILSVLQLKSWGAAKPDQTENISWIKIILLLTALLITLGIPVVWYDLHSSGWFKGMVSIIYGLSGGVGALTLGTIFYFLAKKYSPSWLGAIPVILYCLLLLYFFVVGVNQKFRPFYYLQSRLNPPEATKILNK